MKKKSGKTESTDAVKKDDEEQSARFIETAIELQAEKSKKKLFDNALMRIKTDGRS